jgi:predicted deacylase
MNKTEVVASIVADLHSTEESVDQAIARATTLVQAMIGSRAALNVSACAGAEAQAKAMAAIAALSEARQAMVACHEQLAKDHRRLGFGIYAGNFEDKGLPPTTGEHRLRAV